MRIYPIIVPLLSVLITACSESQHPIEFAAAGNCDAAVSTCQVQYQNIVLELSLGPGVKPLQPFPMKLDIKGHSGMVQNVIADFQMKGMDMGMNRYRLVAEKGLWQANVTLPVCVASRADWLTLIEFEIDGKKYQASFSFQTVMN